MNQSQQHIFEKVVDELQLTQHKAALYIFVERFFSGELAIDHFLDELNDVAEEMGLSDQHVIDLGEALYVQLLSPHRDEIEDAFERNKRPFLDVVAEIKKDLSLTFDEPRLDRRFTHLCEVYLKGEYDYVRILRAFSKGVRAGGLELADVVAAEVVERLDAAMDRVIFEEASVLEAVVERVIRADSGLSENDKKEGRDDMKKDVRDAQEDVVSDTDKQMRGIEKDMSGAREVMDTKEGVADVSSVSASADDVQKSSVSSVRDVQLVDSGLRRNDKKEGLDDRAQSGDDSGDRAIPKKVIVTDEEMDKRVDVALEARKIIKHIGLKFDEEILNRRLHDIVVARLKDIRGPYETRDMVMKAVVQGGLGMDVARAQVFLKQLEDANDALMAQWRARAHKKKQAYVEERRKALFVKPLSPVPVAHHAKSSDIVEVIQKTAPEKRPIVLAEHLQRVKPDMRDVIAPPSLTNPVSELSSYTIEDFHRLHSDPREAIIKIEGKIRLLRDESFVRMKQGIEAWKQSEVMRVYREQLQQSVMGGMPLADVVENRKRAELPFLSQDEISALTALLARLKE